MNKKLLIILCGLKVGGVETYTIRLAQALCSINIKPVILLLTRKYDQFMIDQLSEYADIYWIDEFQVFRGYTSWLNAFIPLKRDSNNKLQQYFDFVHVVDSLCLHFFALNEKYFNYGSITLGAYHEQEYEWWREKNVLFRDEQLILAKLNATSILFANEINREYFSSTRDIPVNKLPLLPLGVTLPSGKSIANKNSLTIVSIGRLVDFKTYNEILIKVMPNLRKMADFRYVIYGDGPAKPKLINLVSSMGLDSCVEFKGTIPPDMIPRALEDKFCFLGSGTSIITASAYGIPSIVGIESNSNLTCGGFFSDIVGYSYNEAVSHKTTPFLEDLIIKLMELNQDGYDKTCSDHINKAGEFNIEKTVKRFVELSKKRLIIHRNIKGRMSCVTSLIKALASFSKPGLISFKRRYYKG